jgi:parvulin-like peptidyl-prolyl isomerase
MQDRRSSAFWLVLVSVLLMAASLSFLFLLRPARGHVTVQHILISFQNTGTNATRTKAEAEALAAETLGRVNTGTDFAMLMKQLSDDPGQGTYSLCDTGVSPHVGDYDRMGMVKAFGDLSFKLEVGEIGMAAYDPKDSPYGWHIIRRIK